MSKLRLNFGLCLLLSLPATVPAVQAQQVKHAPTVEQCRADQNLWTSRMEQPNDAGVNNVTFQELGSRGSEMRDYMNADPEPPESRALYIMAMNEITTVQVNRVTSFIVRHNLSGQFLAEDAQGKH